MEALSEDAKQCWTTAVKDLVLPDFNIVDVHIEPSEVQAVIAARRREVQNLINVESSEWVRNDDVDTSDKRIDSRWEGLPKSDPRK